MTKIITLKIIPDIKRFLVFLAENIVVEQELEEKSGLLKTPLDYVAELQLLIAIFLWSNTSGLLPNTRDLLNQKNFDFEGARNHATETIEINLGIFGEILYEALGHDRMVDFLLIAGAFFELVYLKLSGSDRHRLSAETDRFIQSEQATNSAITRRFCKALAQRKTKPVGFKIYKPKTKPVIVKIDRLHKI